MTDLILDDDPGTPEDPDQAAFIAYMIEEILGGRFGVVPTTGGITPAGGQWYDVITWDDRTGNPTPSSIAADFGYAVIDGAGLAELGKVSLRAAYGIADLPLTFEYFTSNLPEGQRASQWRLIRDTADAYSTHRLQYFSQLDHNAPTVLMFNNLTQPYTTATFGPMVAYTGTPGATMTVLEMENWHAANGRPVTHLATTGGVMAQSIGDPTQMVRWTWRDGNAQLWVADNLVMEFTPDGYRINAGEYPTIPVTQTPPFQANSTPPVLSETTNHFGRTDMTLVSNGTWSQTLQGGQPTDTWVWYGGFNDTIDITFDGMVPGKRLSGTVQMYVNLQIAMVRHFQVVNAADGAVLGSWELNNAPPGFYDLDWIAPEHTSLDDLELRFEEGANNGTNSRPAIYNYGFTLEIVEPAQGADAVAQFDSYDKGILLPSVLAPESGTWRPGIQGNDLRNNNAPWIADGEGIAYFSVLRALLAEVEYGFFLLATGGPPDEQNWTGSFSNWVEVVQDHQGFPDLLHFPDTTDRPGVGTIELQPPANTNALWTAAYRGFALYIRVMFENHAGVHQINIEPINAGGWGAGRFTMNLENSANAGFFTVSDGTLTSIDLPINEMGLLTLYCPDPSSGTAEVRWNGTLLFETTYGGYNGQRGLYIWDNDAATRSVYYQSLSMFVLSSAALDFTLPRRALTTGAIYTTPANVNRLRIPKGAFPYLTKAYIANGGEQDLVISGADDDHIVFGNYSNEMRIAPGKLGLILNKAFPEGSDWAVIGGRDTTTHHAGETFEARIADDGQVLSRGGTYTEREPNSTRVAAGHYTFDFNIAPGPIPLLARIAVTLNLAGQVPPFARWSVDAFHNGLGGVTILTSNDGVATDAPFSLFLSW